MPQVLIVLEVSEKLALSYSVRCIVLLCSLGDCLGHLMLCSFSISLNTFKWSSLGFKRVRFSGYREMGLCLNPFKLLIVFLFFQQSLITTADIFSLPFFLVFISSLAISFHSCLLCVVFPFIANTNQSELSIKSVLILRFTLNINTLHASFP